MDSELRERIIASGVPIELYDLGYTVLGPLNKSSIEKFANINTSITENKFPLFPSIFTEMVVDICTGKSKQDFREIIDGKPGSGKSYSGIYGCCRYAIEAADRHGQDPEDYFTLANAALLQDTAGVSELMDSLDKYQAVLIDDAGVSAGHKDFATQSNKNLDAIMATCRTKRWYVVFTAPMNKHLDLTIRELMYCRGKIYKPCHAANFNIVQQQQIAYKKARHGWDEINPHYVYGDNVRVELYAYFNPELLDPYPNIISEYDKKRDVAADSLIHDKATAEKERKNPIDKREAKFQKVLLDNMDIVSKMTHDANGAWLKRKTVSNRGTDADTYSVNEIMSETGLNDRQVNKIIAHLKKMGAT
jgi:hypothetical protein